MNVREMIDSAGVRERVTYRREPRAQDLVKMRRLVAATPEFYPQERAVALELLEERLARGESSEYFFVFADIESELAGYCAWGPIPLTRASYDLYWIVVGREQQGLGIGRELLRLTESAVAERGGGYLYIETSSRDEYQRTRDFYLRANYPEVARFANFYAPDDAKVVYCKAIARVMAGAK